MLQPSINSSPSSAEKKQHELNEELTIEGDKVEKMLLLSHRQFQVLGLPSLVTDKCNAL